MAFPVVYDITRLATRVLNRTPNGIDRVDLAFARHFLESSVRKSAGSVFTKTFGLTILPREVALDVVQQVYDHLCENSDHNSDPTYARLEAWLARNDDQPPRSVQRLSNPRKPFYSRLARLIFRHGLDIGRSAFEKFPRDARYLNVSQYPLSVPGAFAGLAARPDIKPTFFIHDLLPLEMPEYFKPSEYEKHERRLRNLAEAGAGAIVSTHLLREKLNSRLIGLGRTDLPILRTPIPLPPVFLTPEPSDAEPPRRPYFVLCSTIEPRKNHLLILQVWRELARRRGAATPKLVLVGERGWENENIIDMLERCHSLRSCVSEVSGLPTPSLKRLLSNAAALLMPSFAEGYGLPVVEALSIGTPVIASDLPVFHEIAGNSFHALSPIDGEGWLRTIELCVDGKLGANARPPTPHDQSNIFADVERFLEQL